MGTSLSSRIVFALDAGQFLRLQVQSDGGSEHGFGSRLLRSPRGLRLCAKSDRISKRIDRCIGLSGLDRGGEINAAPQANGDWNTGESFL
jgi:hypothetical protein